MATHTGHYRRRTQFLALLLLGAALAAMFPTEAAWAAWWGGQAAWFAFFLTLLGLGFFIFGRIRATFICLGYAAAISYWLCETGRGELLLDFQTLFFPLNK
ncbi:MAG: hypothetical protein ACR2K1_05010 [Saprospiraceae bacterium]